MPFFTWWDSEGRGPRAHTRLTGTQTRSDQVDAVVERVTPLAAEVRQDDTMVGSLTTGTGDRDA